MEAETKTNPENAVDDLNSHKSSTTNVRMKLMIGQVDPEEVMLEEKKKALEIELRQIEEQKQQEGKEGKSDSLTFLAKEDDLDDRSVFVKNVHFSATEAELREHFQECGEIKRVTILNDRVANQPKG